MKKIILLWCVVILFVSCELNPEDDDSSPFGSSSQVACCYSSTRAIETTGNDNAMTSLQTSCSLQSATFQRGSCSITDKMSGYCNVGGSRKIFYWSSGYTLAEAQSSCSSSSYNDVSGEWVED